MALTSAGLPVRVKGLAILKSSTKKLIIVFKANIQTGAKLYQFQNPHLTAGQNAPLKGRGDRCQYQFRGVDHQNASIADSKKSAVRIASSFFADILKKDCMIAKVS
jgi:hypothetical protein